MSGYLHKHPEEAETTEPSKPLTQEEKIYEEASKQLAHLRWHGERLHHWHVGVTALDREPHPYIYFRISRYDDRPLRTEDVKEYFGVPVHRDLALPRNDIRAISDRHTCHPEEVEA